MRKLWQSCEVNKQLIHGQWQGEGGQLCQLRHLNSLFTAVAVRLVPPFCTLICTSGVQCTHSSPFPGCREHPFPTAAVMHFMGVSISECLPAVLLYLGAMLGREQPQNLSFLVGYRFAGKLSIAGQFS